ncbi:juvenile hormone esterase-like [Lycorma delicatula]|uniref:juvenile hormone esterase-like n=1 Tax=Lycorma delicatula TaxID=130591 RepID=UPI003F51A93F
MGKNTPKCTICVLAVIAVVSFAIVYLVIHHHKPCKDGECIVKIDLGHLKGRERVTVVNKKTYYSFQGIPYAKPPIGSLRFKEPEPVEHWHTVIDATKESNSCLQKYPSQNSSVEGSEDCLYLNIYTTQFPDHNITLHPVMVFIHGGGFTIGSSSEKELGADYLIEKEIVLVTFNYRLGALGFLSLDNNDIPGNAGLKDQLAVLKWVKAHISHFGGDPNNVILFGNSAGSASVVYHLLSPLSKGLFHKVIMESGSALNPWAFQEDPLQNSFKLGKILGTNTTNQYELANFLRNISPSDIASSQSKVILPQEVKNCFSIPFVPSVETQKSENSFLRDYPEKLFEESKFFSVPTIIGTVSNEGLITLGAPDFMDYYNDDFGRFVPDKLHLHQNDSQFQNITESIKQFYFNNLTNKGPLDKQQIGNYVDLCGDVDFNIGIQKIIDFLIKRTDIPLYVYKFTYEGSHGLFKQFLKKKWPTFKLPAGPAHSDEVGYLFYNAIFSNFTESTKENKIVEQMTSFWTRFATFQNPNEEVDNLLWNATSEEKQTYLEIGSSINQKNGSILSEKKQEFWDNIYNSV